jgi:TonB family protein
MIATIAMILHAAAGQSAAQSAEPPFRSAPPPIRAPAPIEPAIVDYRAGEARCGAVIQRPRLAEDPFPAAAVSGIGRAGGEIRLTFRIAADGRPLGIAVDRRSPRVNPDDVPAAFAAWRFEPGARTGCTYTFFRRQSVPLAPPPLPEKAAFRSAGATCPERPPQWESMPPLVFPIAFQRRTIEGWAVLRYDLVPSGATGNVSVLASEPAAAFGEQAVRIVQQARKPADGERYSGCIVRVVFRLPQVGAQTPTPAADEIGLD